MIPGMNPRQMEQAMKKLGIKQLKIEAEEVIIKCSDKNIIIRNPEIVKMNMMGQESLQITGDMHEETISKITEEDISTVVEQTGASKETAEEAIEKNNGDLAAAILELQDK